VGSRRNRVIVFCFFVGGGVVRIGGVGERFRRSKEWGAGRVEIDRAK
jgi:hypothetical protein